MEGVSNSMALLWCSVMPVPDSGCEVVVIYPEDIDSVWQRMRRSEQRQLTHVTPVLLQVGI